MHVPMYSQSHHIPQPPHTSGQAFQGLRTAINPDQVPSPIDTIEADRQTWENVEYPTLPGTNVPLSTTDFLTIDQGNSSPKFIRVTTWSFPSSASLAEDCAIPLATVLQPFAPLDAREEPVPIVQCDENGPVRCFKCRAYVNPWIKWVADGRRWSCNICGHETDVPPEYFSPLTLNHVREDAPTRPELSKGTVDFALPHSCTAYWAPWSPPRISPPYYSPLAGSRTDVGREPSVMDFVVALDISRDSVGSGFLRSTCEALRRMIFGSAAEDEPNGTNKEGCWPRGSRIAVIAFDCALYFHNLGSAVSPPPLIVLPDIDEPFAPLLEGLFVDPYDPRAREQLTSLLLAIPERYQDTTVTDSCLGSAMRASLACLANRGGTILAFQSTLPRIGPGALTLPSPTAGSSAVFSADKEQAVYIPANGTWPEIGQEMVEEGVGLCLWLAGQSEIGVASVGIVPTLTGGDIFFHPRFNPSTDSPVLHAQLQRVLTRTTGYNASLKIRCSPGLRIASTSYTGLLFQRTPTEVEFGTLTADHAISATIEHTHKLDEREYAYLQAAVLYTTREGERRVRVCNLALQVVGLAGNVFQYADMDTVVCHFAREAISQRTSQPMSHIRDDLTEKCSAILLGYRRNCGASTPSSQLLIPEAFRSLPVFTLAILKCKAIKARNVSPDVRNYSVHRFLSMSVRSTIHHLYPPLLALHDLSDDIALPDPATGLICFPALMRNSHMFMISNGIYLIDNGEMMIFWVGSSVSPQLLKDLFGVDDIMMIDPYITRLPVTRTRISAQVQNIVINRQATRARTPKLYIARQNIDGAELEFSDMLVEDQNNAALSYIDYLCIVHKQINHALTNGRSLSGTTSFRGSPW